MSRVIWPENKSFAFTVFDDPDRQTLQNGKPVYDFLTECGLRTTKGVWPLDPVRQEGVQNWGDTCADPRHLDWVLALQAAGFEIGYHGALPHTATRDETIAGLERFRELFGHPARTMTQHVFSEEALYWGELRTSGANRALYNLFTLGRNRGRFRGQDRDDPCFWGDLCKSEITYMRNFVFSDTNTLKACPFMPYHDPDRPYVNLWFCSSEGMDVSAFNDRISEESQDRLEDEGGACIMYTHFAFGFLENGRLNTRFRFLIERLAAKNGWFVPIHTLLEHLVEQRGPTSINAAQRRLLERRWLRHKIRSGTS
jgi:hypothetical protein